MPVTRPTPATDSLCRLAAVTAALVLAGCDNLPSTNLFGSSSDELARRGYAISASSSYNRLMNADEILETDPTRVWHSRRRPYFPETIDIVYAAPREIGVFGLYHNNPRRAPKEFRLEAKDGTAWRPVLNETDGCIPPDEPDREWRLSPPVRSNHFRLVMFSNCGDNEFLSFRRLRLDAPGTPRPGGDLGSWRNPIASQQTLSATDGQKLSFAFAVQFDGYVKSVELAVASPHNSQLVPRLHADAGGVPGDPIGPAGTPIDASRTGPATSVFPSAVPVKKGNFYRLVVERSTDAGSVGLATVRRVGAFGSGRGNIVREIPNNNVADTWWMKVTLTRGLPAEAVAARVLESGTWGAPAIARQPVDSRRGRFLSISFAVPENALLEEIKVDVADRGSGTLIPGLHEDNGGVPGALVGVRGSPIELSTSGEKSARFSPPVPVQGGRFYRLVLEASADTRSALGVVANNPSFGSGQGSEITAVPNNNLSNNADWRIAITLKPR